MDQSPLISPGELAELMHGGPGSAPLILDVRWSADSDSGWEDYLQGHLPGAIYVDLEHDLAGVPDESGRGGRHPMPAPDDFELDLAGCGVDDGRRVVVYDDQSGLAAARCWWLLRHFGKTDVCVLDGGFQAWRAHRLPVESGERDIEEGDLSLGRGMGLVLEADQAALYASEGVLIDARSPERFRGESDPMDAVLGHIPGAVNVPGRSLITGEGMLLPADDLRQVFTEAGVDGSCPVAVYCGSGISSGLVALALAVAGVDDEPALYIGSWSDWISDRDRPVATGD
ncbi:thiosulfate/3-mercaptopyruvate sulfurtransferase [Austwickia chelonae]|uniref:Putative 3-mercaptopyruvate sulfurtransferase n=1 Tax=Austwickia chelonae NBRC 105200 TaxID=1184607 RepID=K6VQC4_9MICO|nr:sulfurtransferase [Austwickia chelonae]GAB77550.1 putative 3-mercaptopyruvate sulfurtransferase [Austwickia chelonae NBRC 105200]SEW12677.1 thiosulfate/3-mercaptopyruvate sulfurtransferase [Austwickia chelonae]